MGKRGIIKEQVEMAVRKLHYQFKKEHNSEMKYTTFLLMMRDKSEFIEAIAENCKIKDKSTIMNVLKGLLWYK